MPARPRRPIVWSFAGLGALAVLGLALHSPPARSLAQGWLIERLRTRAALDLSAERLDYNLLTLSVRLTTVEVRPVGQTPAAEPLFEAALLEAKLPWSIFLRGAFAIETIRLVQPRLTLVRSAERRWNLPSRWFEPSTRLAPGAPPVGAVTVTGGSVRYADRQRGLTAEVRDLDVTLRSEGAGSLVGTVQARATVSLGAGGRAVRLSRVAARLRMERTAIIVDSLSAEAPDGTLELTGRVRLAGPTPTLDFRYRGSLALERFARRWESLGPVPGTLAVQGGIAGPWTTPALTVALTGRTVGGTIGAAGRIAWSGPRPAATFTARVEGLDLGGALAALRLEPPVPLRSKLDGRIDVTWDATAIENWRIVVETIARRPAAGPRVPAADGRALRGLDVAGRSLFRLENGMWTWQPHLLVASNLEITGRLGGRVGTGRPSPSLSGVLHVRARRLAPSLHALGAAGLVVSPLAEIGLDGTLGTTVRVQGSLAHPRLTALVEIANFQTRSSDPGHLRGRIALDPDRLAVDALELVDPPNRLRLRGRVALRTRRVEARLDGELGAPARWLRLVPEPWRPAGSVTLAGHLEGALDDPHLTMTLASRGVTVLDQPPVAMHAQIVLARGTAIVQRAVMQQEAGGELSFLGRVDFRRSHYQFAAHATAFDLHPVDRAPSRWRVPLRARVSGALDARGVGRRATGSGQLIFDRLAWRGVDVGPTSADLRLDRDRVVLNSRAPELGLTALLVARLDAPFLFTLQGEIRESDLGRWARLLVPADLPLGGRTTIRVEAAGSLTDPFATDAAVAIDTLVLEIGQGRLVLERPGYLRYAAGNLAASPLTLRVGATSLTVSGLLATGGAEGRLSGRLDGRLGDLVPLVAGASGLPLRADGSLRAEVDLSGTPAAPALEGALQVTDGCLAVGALPELTDLTVRARVGQGRFTLERVAGRWQEGVVTASGEVPLRFFGTWLPLPAPRGRADAGPLRLTGRIDGITTRWIDPWRPTTASDLTVDAAARFAIEADALTLARLRGDLTFERLRLVLARVPVEQRRPTRLGLEGGRLEVADWVWGGPTTEFAVGGGMDLVPRPRIDARLQGTLDLATLGAVLPALASSGTARVDLRVAGTPATPDVTGVVQVAEGEIRWREPRVVLSGFTGTLVLAPSQILVRAAHGTLNGGTVRISGSLDREGLEVKAGALTAAIEGAALAWPKGVRAEVGGQVTLTPRPEGWGLSGRLTIEQGTYREPVLLTGQVLDALRRPAGVAAAGAAWGDRLQLDLALTTREELLVDNNYGHFGVGVDLRLGGTPSDPELLGRITLGEGGRLYLGGRVYRIERGRFDFPDPRALVPDIEFIARTRAASSEITLRVRGTPPRLESTLTADDPTLSGADIVSLLATGRRASGAGPLAADLRDQMLSYLSGDLLSLAGEQVGLDVVRLERGLSEELVGADPTVLAAETDPAMRVSLTKRLSDQVEIVLSQNLRQAGALTWIATYRPMDNVELRGVVRDDDSRAVEVSHRPRVGAAGPARAERAARRLRPRIAAIRIGGDAGYPERVLRRTLGLAVGDRFDFFEWQEARDRLERFYQREGFLEARVRAQREELPARDGPAVALTYLVARGPRTAIRFEGYSPSARLQRELDALWAGAVFDEFLVEDAAARVRTDLVRAGFLRARVTPALIEEPDERPPRKLLRVQVTPGPRTTERQIAFQGHAHLSTDALLGFLREQHLELAAWVAPEDVAAALRERYGRDGYLATRVTVGPARVDDARAVLPVEIVEGPLFRVGTLAVEGARARPVPAVVQIFGLEPGRPYRATDVEAGRRAVEAAYRRDGYTRARVRVARRIDPTRALVHLTVLVEEGTRDLLTGVRVDGGRPRTAELVTRTLPARIGDPVNLDAWHRARTRLYDTGHFRSVDIQFEPDASAPALPGSSPVRARILVEEFPLYRLRYGLQVGDRFAPSLDTREPTWGVTADLQRRAFFAPPLTAGVTARYEPDRWLARGIVQAPRLGPLPLASSLYLTRSRDTVRPEGARAFVTDKTTVTAQQEATLGRWGRLTYGVSFARNHTFDPQARPDDPLALDITLHLARLTAAFTAERRDDPFDPRRGWFHLSTVEYAPAALGSDLRFVKYVAQTALFHPWGPVVLAGNARVGLARGFGQQVVRSERFLAGGGTSVRGYGQDALGPLDLFGDPAGGDALVVLNGELRAPLARRIRAVGFVDAGNVFRRVADLDLGALRVGLGAGLRVDTPFALVRFDVGRPVPRRPGERAVRWYLSLGHVF